MDELDKDVAELTPEIATEKNEVISSHFPDDTKQDEKPQYQLEDIRTSESLEKTESQTEPPSISEKISKDIIEKKDIIQEVKTQIEKPEEISDNSSPSLSGNTEVNSEAQKAISEEQRLEKLRNIARENLKKKS